MISIIEISEFYLYINNKNINKNTINDFFKKYNITHNKYNSDNYIHKIIQIIYDYNEYILQLNYENVIDNHLNEYNKKNNIQIISFKIIYNFFYEFNVNMNNIKNKIINNFKKKNIYNINNIILNNNNVIWFFKDEYFINDIIKKCFKYILSYINMYKYFIINKNYILNKQKTFFIIYNMYNLIEY